MANANRGEVEITLAGDSYTLRPSFQALCEIEEATGMGIAALLRRYGDGAFGVRDVAAVLWAGIRATDRQAPRMNEIGEIIVEEGLAAFVEPVGRFLARAVSGGGRERPGEAQKKPAAPERTPTAG